MQRLSIIVPLMGNLKRLEDTLVSVLENQPERSEVVVVLNEPYDDPYELRGEVKFVEAPPGADLVDCFACGLAASSAPVVHVIAAGFEATPGWAEAALARFAEADVAAVAPVVVDRDHPQRILSAGLRWTAAGSIGRIAAGKRLDRFAANDRALCGPELAVAFYRRDVLETVESLQHYGSDLAAATDLALALRKAGYRAVQEPACVTTATSELLGHPLGPAAPGGKALPASGFSVALRRFRVGNAPGPHMPGWWPWSACSCRCGPRFWHASPAACGPRWAAARRVRWPSVLRARPASKEAVIRPPQFSTSDGASALHSRAAG